MITISPPLPEAFAAFMALPDKERIRSVFAERFIHHEQVSALLTLCGHLMNKPPGLRPKGLLVSAPSGAGKTALAEAMMRQCNGRDASLERPASQPVVYFCMSNAREAKEIYARLLVALGAPHFASMSGNNRRALAMRLA